MAERPYTIEDLNGQAIRVTVRRDKRLKKSSRWSWGADGSILLRIPYFLPKKRVGNLLDQIAAQLEKENKLASRRTDAELQLRAERINQRYFKGKVQWRAIRWVSNMQQRLGSCTQGGPTDGHIRISDKIKNWPDWVIDYVIAHELVHRIYPNHSDAFWETVTQAYPLTERARGFIQGAGFVEGQAYDDD